VTDPGVHYELEKLTDEEVETLYDLLSKAQPA
jgi:hypothetical protein